MSSITALTSLVTPPTQPSDVGQLAQWPQVEAELGIALPSDYKAFLATYGSGSFNDFMIIFNPFSPSPHDNLLHDAV
jgi:hypothetical protein